MLRAWDILQTFTGFPSHKENMASLPQSAIHTHCPVLTGLLQLLPPLLKQLLKTGL